MTSTAIPTDWDTAYPAQRRMMVECQVRTFDVTDHAVLEAMLDIPREAFVDPKLASLAYADRPLTALGGRRQLLPPMVLARMLQAAEVRPGDEVLEVGGGSAYGAAILARLSGSVATLECDEAQTLAAREALARAGSGGVVCVTGALPDGYVAGAPFEVIVVNGAVHAAPATLLDQLADGGRLVAILVGDGAPKAVLYEKLRGTASMRPLFDAAASVLDGFSPAPSFVF